MFISKNKNKAASGALSSVEAEVTKLKEDIETNT
jgi:hypothetical protein